MLNHKTLSIMLGMLLLIVGSAAFGALPPPIQINPYGALPPRVSWTPAQLTPIMATGTSTSHTVVLKHTGLLPILATNQLRIVAEGAIKPFVKIIQPKFPSVFKRGNQVTVPITVSIPANTPSGKINGKLVLKHIFPNGKEIEVWRADALPVTVTVTEPPTATFFPGTDTIVTSKSIDAYGGVITIQNTGTPIDGVTVSVPAGALNKTTTFSVGYNTGALSLVSGTPSGVILILDGGGVTTFANPITITAPFNGDNTVIPVPYYIDASGKLHLAQLVNVDRTAKTISFQTFHASWYTWVIANVPGLSTVFDTGYTPPNDGFQIVNTGSSYNRRGVCFGMTSFSLWYYETKKSSNGMFYPKYMNVIGTDSSGAQLRGQNIIATRSFISIAQKWNSYLPLVASQKQLTDAEKVVSIENALENTNNPVLIYLYGGGGSGTHSVLAHGFDSLSSLATTIHIYDPNYPSNTNRYLSYNVLTGLSPYDGHTSYIYNGDGSLNLTEPYQNILDNADVDFQNSADATINVTSDTSGETVHTRNISLSGTVASGQVLVNKLTVFVGSTSFSSLVGLDGSFSIPLSLNTGVNHLQFVTEGNDANGQLITLPNNLVTTDFTINSDVPLAEILMTLTWDTNGTDLDTYVIDPSGDYSAYYHKVTADGGTLDFDVTTGFGPEHWTLLSTDTIRYDQPYNFRVHYYSDHANGPSNYTVTITLHQGTPQETTSTYSGTLAVSNPSNGTPTGVGPDWADIATITIPQPQPTQQSQLRALALPISTQEIISPPSDIVITAPVPPLDQRIK